MKKLILLLVLLTTTSFGADFHSPYDPGAARSTLSNVDPATGRAALELGTMAVATATDYVATDTFTGHTGATGASVHGLGTISTQTADNVAITGGSVTGLSALSTTGETLIATSTDAGDYKLQVAGSAFIGVTANSNSLYINKYSVAVPMATIVAGDSDRDAPEGFRFLTRDAAGTAADVMRLTASGAVLIATTTDDLTHKLQVLGPVKFMPGLGVEIVTEILLADDAEVNIATLLGATTRNMGSVRVSAVASGYFIDAHIAGGDNAVTLLTGVNAAVSDTDTKLCVYYTGTPGVYNIKNRIGGPSTFIVEYLGRK
jgi:hypothetical protein